MFQEFPSFASSCGNYDLTHSFIALSGKKLKNVKQQTLAEDPASAKDPFNPFFFSNPEPESTCIPHIWNVHIT